MLTNYLGKRIVDLREARDIKQTELARKLHIDKSTMSKIESGDRKVYSDEISALADIFDISADYLLGRDSHPHHDSVFDLHVDIPLDGMSTSQRQAVIDYINFLKQQYKNEMEDKKVLRADRRPITSNSLPNDQDSESTETPESEDDL
ncbi:helix-turn-helix domain-containing protein [Lentilactobacillus laojiaonis]|uniref:helix-turn-helix domain-containing protein n=1 Tax=Lentilactobacillus laojiaonis TaxID=2883998 RepID=UPI001D0B10B8|nr:helix-turn-helix transcriptional regulator [Lentilactobacillus laojiaonis]UDM32015.1 helix-turn-helix domain-containing protein [Lentilactobacillus laojiaonis]